MNTIFLIIVLCLLIAFLFYNQRKRKRIKPGKTTRLISFANINNPKGIEAALDQLTDEELREYEEHLEKNEYKIGNLGYYLRDRFDEMKIGDYRRGFILVIVSKFRLENQFSYKEK